MKDFIKQRAIKEADYILRSQCTIRQCAKVYGVSKSTVHLDVTIRLKKINNSIYLNVQKLLEYNNSVKHIRGGESVKNKALFKK